MLKLIGERYVVILCQCYLDLCERRVEFLLSRECQRKIVARNEQSVVTRQQPPVEFFGGSELTRRQIEYCQDRIRPSTACGQACSAVCQATAASSSWPACSSATMASK